MTNLYNLEREELARFLEEMGVEPYRATQLFKWVYNKGERDFNEMTDVPRSLRHAFSDIFSLHLPEIERCLPSKDGSVKFLFLGKDGQRFESLYIPDGTRRTVCVSTQVGCRMGCTFCVTAKIGFRRNLSAAEMVGQIVRVREYTGARITNLVFMGMGEPLDNLVELRKAIRIFTDPYGLALSWRRITVSTVGLLDRLGELRERVNLAVSLNAPTDEKRTMLMPINRLYGVRKITEFARAYTEARRERITFEYVLIGDVNDSIVDAKELAGLLKGLECKINLIPLNESPFFSFRRPPDHRIREFQSYLIQRHFTAILREERGTDVFGGCGQLGMSLLASAPSSGSA
jgi:23S rRNA (adenine2503-C2)-methyltransferase